MKRNTTISICKGIAIILMVIAHAEAPGWLCKFIFEFHMPLFFITAGYFFSLKYLNDEASFVKKRVKGLYWPFVKWSVFFLIIHNCIRYSRICGISSQQWVATTSFSVARFGFSEACLWRVSYTLLYIS